MVTEEQLIYYESGDPNGAPLVLVHGGGGGIWGWEEMLKSLPGFHCYLPELPEHGSSQKNGPFTVKATAKTILGMIRERIPGGRAHCFGHSVGGQVLVEMLAEEPERVSTAIISGAQVLPVPGYRLGIYSEPMMALLYWLGIAPWKHNDAWIRWNMHSLAGIPENFFERYKKNFQGLTRDTWAHVMNENYRYRAPQGLEQAHVPVLLIAGAHETIDIQPTNRYLMGRFPESRSILLDPQLNWPTPQEHNWPLSAPQLCAQTIQMWVEQRSFPGDAFIEMK